jgi:hypothetical protein
MAMNLLRAFTEHPASVGESYFGHLLQASTFGLRMVFAGVACVLHGIFPFLFVTTGSDAMKSLNEEMSARRARALGREAAIR